MKCKKTKSRLKFRVSFEIDFIKNLHYITKKVRSWFCGIFTILFLLVRDNVSWRHDYVAVEAHEACCGNAETADFTFIYQSGKSNIRSFTCLVPTLVLLNVFPFVTRDLFTVLIWGRVSIKLHIWAIW